MNSPNPTNGLIQELESMLRIAYPKNLAQDTPEEFEQSKHAAVEARIRIELEDPADSDEHYGAGFADALQAWAIRKKLIPHPQPLTLWKPLNIKNSFEPHFIGSTSQRF